MNAIEDAGVNGPWLEVRRKSPSCSFIQSDGSTITSQVEERVIQLKEGNQLSDFAEGQEGLNASRVARFEPSCPTSRSSGWPMPSPKIAKFLEIMPLEPRTLPA